MNTYGETEKEIIGYAREITGIECDSCRKIILPKSETCKENKYYKVTTGHNDWGNDSIESIENHDICLTCLPFFVRNYFDSHHGTAYLNIETSYIYPNRYEKYRERGNRILVEGIKDGL